MLKCTALFFTLLFSSFLHAKDPALQFTVKTARDQPALTIDANGSVKEALPDKVGSLFLTCTTAGQDATVFKFFVAGKEAGGFLGSDKDKELASALFADLRGQVIQIRDNAGRKVLLSFTLPAAGAGGGPQNAGDAGGQPGVRGGGARDGGGRDGGGRDGGGGGAKKVFSALDTVKAMFPTLAITQFGLQVPAGNSNTIYTGQKYVHIFLDQYGNNLFTTIPAGISNRQYVVHIFYLQNVDDPNEVAYSVNQLEGEFQDAIVFNNAGQLNSFSLHANEGNVYKWATKEYLLSTSTTDIKFEVVRTSPNKDDATKTDNQSLKTYTIKMSKVYHGSFDVGLINTTLENPDFTLLASAGDPNVKVVKKTGGGNRGVVTAMASFYASPIIILESIFGNKQIPPYKLTGRNFLDDHKIYERIYPTVGVGFTDKTLENLFFGFNWEFARGGAIFAGWHYGKVNTYDGGSGFVFEQTPVTDAEFALKQNTAWKTSFAIGLKLDIMIIRNLFGAATAAPAASGN